MKNKILLIIVIFIIILCVAIYLVYNYRVNIAKSQEINNEYKSYYNKQIIGTDLASVINKTRDNNEKNNIPKDNSGYFIENDTNSIKVFVELIYQDDYTTLDADQIFSKGIENFVRVYSTANFKCTKITYHKKTSNVETVIFTEVSETLQTQD